MDAFKQQLVEYHVLRRPDFGKICLSHKLECGRTRGNPCIEIDQVFQMMIMS